MDRQTGSLGPLDAMDDTEGTETTEVEVTRTRIEQTRSEMGDTIEAIKEKLNPQVLTQQAKDTVHSVTADLAQQAKETVHSVSADLAQQAKETIHAVTTDVVTQAKQNLPEMTANMAHQAVGSAVDTAKEAVGDAVDTAKEAVGGAVGSARSAGSSVVEMIQRNPIPAALIGIGLSWLYMSNRRNNSTSGYYNRRNNGSYGREYGESYRSSDMQSTGEKTGVIDTAKDAVGGAVGTARETVGGAVSSAREAVGGAVGTAREAVGGAVSSARETMGSVVHTAKDKAGDVVDTARNAGSSVVEMIQHNPMPAALMATSIGWLLMSNRQSRESRPFMEQRSEYERGTDYSGLRSYDETSQGSEGSRSTGRVQRTTEGIQRTLQQNPVAAGAVSLGLGAALGLLLPESRLENEWMGETRNRLVDKAQETAQDIGMKVQIVAEEAVEAAKGTARQEAKNQGLPTK